MNFDFADILLEVIDAERLGPPPHRGLAADGPRARQAARRSTTRR